MDWNTSNEKIRGTHYHKMDAHIQNSDVPKKKKDIQSYILYLYFISSDYKRNKKL